MWILTSGKIINSPRPVSIGDVNYSRNIFIRWSFEELLTLGIRPFREESYDSRYYRSTGTTDTLIDGVVVRSHTTVNRYTGQELRDNFIVRAKQRLRSLWRMSEDELDYLLNFDPSNQTDIDAWSAFQVNLKLAFTEAKSQLQAITNYEEGVEFVTRGFIALLPIPPNQPEGEVV